MSTFGPDHISCPTCGLLNQPRANYCSGCGSAITITQTTGGMAGPSVVRPVNIPNYLAQAILVTIFCCVPFGIVSIVYAAQVNGKIAAGDYAGAMDASNKAKTWAWVSFGVGLASVLLWVPFTCAAPFAMWR